MDPSGNKYILDSIAKKIWKAGAEHYLANRKGYYLTATLLEMSTGASGQRFTSNNGEYASNLLKNDSGFHNAINDMLWEKGTRKGETWVSFNMSYSFNNGDAFAALHNVNALVAGYVNDKGQWVVNVQVTDVFDFTEIKNPLAQETFQQGLLWFANDVAVVNTNMDILQPVDVVIRFNDIF